MPKVTPKYTTTYAGPGGRTNKPSKASKPKKAKGPSKAKMQKTFDKKGIMGVMKKYGPKTIAANKKTKAKSSGTHPGGGKVSYRRKRR